MENRLKQRRVSYFEEYGGRDEKHATAVAAAAFAIHSLQEAESLNARKLKEVSISSSRTMTRKEERRPSNARENAFPVRRPSGTPPPQKQRGSPIPAQHNNVKAKADAWEKANMEKIHKRYEKTKSKILLWENEQKMQTKLHMERKNLSEHRRAIELQYYQNKIARINMIAQEAKAQLEDKRRKKESRVRETANQIRKTGRVPIKCFCFIF